MPLAKNYKRVTPLGSFIFADLTPEGSHVSSCLVPGGNIFLLYHYVPGGIISPLYHLVPGGNIFLLYHLVPGGKMVPDGLIFFFGPFAQRGSFAHKYLFDINFKFCTFKS